MSDTRQQSPPSIVIHALPGQPVPAKPVLQKQEYTNCCEEECGSDCQCCSFCCKWEWCCGFWVVALILIAMALIGGYIYGMYATYPKYHSADNAVTAECENGQLINGLCSCYDWWAQDEATHMCTLKLKSWKHAVIGITVPPLGLLGYGAFHIGSYVLAIVQLVLISSQLLWLCFMHRGNDAEEFAGAFALLGVLVFAGIMWVVNLSLICANNLKDENGNYPVRY